MLTLIFIVQIKCIFRDIEIFSSQHSVEMLLRVFNDHKEHIT